MAPQLLLTYDFPPIGGGIARWMAELAKRYPPGSLVVNATGPDTIRLLPPLTVSDDEIDEAVERIGKAL